MSSVQTLPPELWLIIFDFVVASSIGLQHSNHIAFPESLHRFRYPWTYPPTLSNIRLVCRLFNGLLAPSPYLFLKSRDTIIPNSTRAVFIYPHKVSLVLLQHLLAEPSKTQTIVMLDLTVFDYPNLFSSTSSVRTPTLFPISKALTSPFRFTTLGRAYYPISGAVSITLSLASYVSCCEAGRSFRQNSSRLIIVFERLKILDFDGTFAEPKLHFPMLCHAAFAFVTNPSASLFTVWALLESLLIREAETYSSRRDFWDLVPRLVLLALPSQSVELFASVLPFQHALQHLYIYVASAPRNDHYQNPERKNKELVWLKRVLGHLPTVKRLTLAYRPVSNRRSSSIRGDFDEEELALMGFIRDHSDVRSSHRGRRTVLRRLDSEPQIEPRIGAVSQGKGIRAGWDRFSGFLSCKFHFNISLGRYVNRSDIHAERGQRQ
jgi:hypothetical protein